MGNWSLELGERPLNANRFVRFFLGNKISHSFPRLIDDKGQDLLELHGLYTTGYGAAFNTAAKVLLGRPLDLSHLHVSALTSPHLMNVFLAHHPVTRTVEEEGSEDKILRDAECLVRTAIQVQKDRRDYFFDLHGGGITCHSVSAELFRRIGIDLSKQKLPFETPGREFNLEKIEPALAAIVPDTQASLDEIKKRIVEEVKILSPDFNDASLLAQLVPSHGIPAAKAGIAAHL